MKRRRRILSVSAILVLLAVIDFAIMLGAGNNEPMIVGIWRMFLTLLLAAFLASGNNFTRWITVILMGLGAFGGMIAIPFLIFSGSFGPGYGLRIGWLVLTTVSYAAIGGFLALSKGVSREIRRAETRI